MSEGEKLFRQMCKGRRKWRETGKVDVPYRWGGYNIRFNLTGETFTLMEGERALHSFNEWPDLWQGGGETT